MKIKKVSSPAVSISSVLLFALLLIFAGIAVCAEKPVVPSKTYNWKMTSFFPSGMAMNRPMIEFAKTLEQRTNGAVKITIYEGTLGAPGDHWDMLKRNAIQIAYTGEANNPGRLPVLGLTNLPFEFPELSLQGTVAKELTDNFKVVAFLPLSLQNMFLSKKKVSTLSDLKGMKIRSASGTQGKVVSALGATGVSMPGGETYMALQTGVIDGTVTGVDYVVDNKFYEICKYGLQNPIYGGVFILIMNKETWDSLQKDLQATIEQVGRDVSDRSTKMLIDEAQKRWETLRERKMEVYAISQEEEAQWKKATAGVADQYVQEWSAKGYPVKEALAMMRKVVGTSKK
jgi:TRAP-type C4-dicarboxylate transport system substrate-binding protein